MAATNYYDKVVNATEEFLGPAAERFINRQIEFHLGKEPETINKEDVLKISDSLGVALGLLVDDEKLVQDAVHKIDMIAQD